MKKHFEIKQGFAGTLARMFIQSKLTLLIALASLLLGFMAIYLTGRPGTATYPVALFNNSFNTFF